MGGSPRMENERAVLTLKGPRTGATAAEHEFPVDDARARCTEPS